VKEPGKPICFIGSNHPPTSANKVPALIRKHAMKREPQSAIIQEPYTLVLSRPLSVLTPRQVQLIDRALASLGPFSEVRLVKMGGKLRFIQTLDSESALEQDSM
jgi:hypothetical protein